MLRLKDIRKGYSNFELNGSLEVPDNCIVGVVGANGAGKTTLFKIILGLIRAEAGEMELFHEKITRPDPGQLAEMGVVLSDAGPLGGMTIKSYLPVLEALYPTFDRAKFLNGCEKFHLPTDQWIQEFSTGMKKKLQVLIALSHESKLLILDEPTAGMDVVVREELLDLLREYMETNGRSILISSHISGDLEGFCDEIYMIDEGKIILHENVDRLLEEYGLLKLTEEQYQKLDKKFLLRVKKEAFGCQCLTNERQYYVDNYPQIAVENGSIDTLLYMMIRGESV